MGAQVTKSCCSGDHAHKASEFNKKDQQNKPLPKDSNDHEDILSIEAIKSSLLQSPKIKQHYHTHENLFTRLVAHRQDHLLLHMQELNPAELDAFYDVLYEIDFELVDMMFNHLVLRPPKKSNEPEKLEPMPNRLKIADVDPSERAKLVRVGLEMIARGKLAVVLLSGGQGTRFGFGHAKGMYKVGTPSNKSLFQYFAERMLKVARLAVEKCGTKKQDPRDLIQFYIMTNDTNHQETKQFFAENLFFGLNSKHIHFFCQQSLPTVDLKGKVILERKNKISLAPNGNGGCLTCLAKNNLVTQMKNSGVTHVQIFGVENLLTKVADPYFLGYAETKNYDVTCKYVPKNIQESRDIFILKGGKPHVIENNEIPRELLELKNEYRELVFDAADVVNTIFKIDFLDAILATKKKELASRYHIAKKQIHYYDEKVKQTVIPLEPNGYKFELYLSDCFQLCAVDKFGLVETKREEEFAPIINAPGSKEDTPEIAREMLSKLHMSWLERHSVEFDTEHDETGELSALCEIDPLVSYEGEGLEGEALKLKGSKVMLPLYIR